MYYLKKFIYYKIYFYKISLIKGENFIFFLSKEIIRFLRGYKI